MHLPGRRNRRREKLSSTPNSYTSCATPLKTCPCVAILTVFQIPPMPLARVRTYSRTLAALVQGYALRDVWTQPTANRTYTHYWVTEATRIDRFYVTPTLHQKKAAETVVAPYTEHHAVILKLGVDVPHAWHGRGLWKLNADIIHGPVRTTILGREWKRS